MEFLKGFIGLSSTLGVEAPSGLYVDALPDITTDTIAKLTREGEDPTDTWSRIEWRTLLKFRSLFASEVEKCHTIPLNGSVEDADGYGVYECLIKENKAKLATALWYLLGSEVMIERGASNRMNVATIDRSKPKEIREYLEDKFKEELKIAVSRINIHASSCFLPDETPECKPFIQTAYIIP